MHEQADDWIDGRGVALFALFALVVLGLLLATASDLRPQPIYAVQESHPDAPAVFATRRLGVEVELRDLVGVERIRVPVWTDATRKPLEIDLALDREAVALVRVRVAEAGLAAIDVPESIPPGATLWLRLRSDGESRETSPRVLWARSPPRGDVRTYYAGRPLAMVEVLPQTGVLLLIEYEWPTRGLVWLWLIPIVALPLVLRRPQNGFVWLAALALAASVTSAMLWQRDYTRRAVHVDADQYTESATKLARYLTQPGEREAIRTWLRSHPHTTTLGVPALLALPVAAGVPVQVAYMQLCALAGFVTLLLLQRLMAHELGVDACVAWLVVGAFACHPSLLRAFARPSTDVVGLLLVVWTLTVLVRRMSRSGEFADFWLGALLLAHALSRPQGLGYWPFFVLAAIAADSVRTGDRIVLASSLRTGLRVLAPPGVVLAGLFLGLGWVENFELMLDKASRFRVNSTLGIFVFSLVGSVQWLPVLWWFALPRLREPRVALVALFGVYAVALIVAVRAPFWPRHFLPALPSVFVLAAVGLDALRGRGRRAAEALLLVTALLGVAVTLWQVHDMAALPAWLAGLVRSP